jgi:Tfp pilus assembly protein PilV
MRGQRGATLIELMIAATIVLIALLGFIGTMNTAARATAVGHRRTVASHLRTAVLDRFAVTPRDRVATLTPNAWVVGGCMDIEARPLATNDALLIDFVCPPGTTYQSWVRVDPAGTRTWAVHAYVERTDSPCPRERRYASLSCVAGDLYLTD